MAKTTGRIKMARGMRFGYEKIPAEVVMIPEDILCSRGKRLCGYIGSFGVKGCYQSKTTLGRYFGVSRRTMIRLVKRVKELRRIIWVDMNGVPGCMWLRCDPRVQAAERLFYRGRSIKNPACTCDKSVTGGVAPMSQVPGAPVSQDNNRTKRTTTAASLSPAEVQARQRKKEEADARCGIQSNIRAEIVRHSQPVPAEDLEAKERRLPAIAEFEGKAEELVQDGISVDDAVRKVLGKKFIEAREE